MGDSDKPLFVAFQKDASMLSKLTATVALLFLAGSATAATLDGCKLLSQEFLEQLQVPDGATASPDWAEKDRLQLCRYALGDSFKLQVSFGKPPEENLRKIEDALKTLRSASQKGLRPGADVAFSESDSCVATTLPEGQMISCQGIRKGNLLMIAIMRLKSIEPMKNSASSLLPIFNNVFAELPL